MAPSAGTRLDCALQWFRLSAVLAVLGAFPALAQVLPLRQSVSVVAEERPVFITPTEARRERSPADTAERRGGVTWRDHRETEVDIDPKVERRAPDDRAPELDFYFTLSTPDAVLVSGFNGGTSDGAVRTGTTWVGQVTQHEGTLTVGGAARDDNGWGAKHLSLNASGMQYLNITAQRDAGHLAPTLFIQFEDLNLQTKVVAVSTSQFTPGSQTLVQVPLSGWTIDFGPSQITSWSLGGGSVGTTDFRMTFDSITFTTTAIPEPAAFGVMLAGLSVLGTAAWRRRRRSPRNC